MEIDEIASRLEAVDRTTPPTTVTARTVGERLTGRTQPWKQQAGDGNWYVVKAQNNPQDILARRYARHAVHARSSRLSSSVDA